jgi:D-alanyl-D-alanine carboxypeptidase/D-alanyl-D-alanine-endopeptidase (penicillin-binding protein 4)
MQDWIPAFAGMTNSSNVKSGRPNSPNQDRKVLATHLIAALLFAFLCAAQASAASLPTSVRDELRRARIPLAHVGIVVQQIDSDATLLSLNSTNAMNPASTMKLLTTIAALDILGPAYRWKTEVFIDGRLENGALDGNLVFKGYGDPKLTMEQFWLWLRELRQLGLRDIRGDIVFDRSYFDLPQYDPARFDSDPTRAYNVGPSALLLNFNALRFRMTPEASKVDVLIDPDLTGYTVINNLKIARSRRCSSGNNYDIRLKRHEIVLNGAISSDCGAVDKYLSLLPHDEYFFAVFNALWKELGGTISGTFHDGRVPENLLPFSTHTSIPLSEVIRDINKFSNNLMARQLFLTLAAPAGSAASEEEVNETADSSDDYAPDGHDPESTAPVEDPEIEDATQTTNDSPESPASGVQETRVLQSAVSRSTPTSLVGTTAKSKVVIRDWLRAQGLNFPELVMENGAGLSRIARISPQHLADALQHAAAGPYASELEASLPILGMDGTLKKRLNGEEIAGYAHLKTGLLSGVKSIAGYIRSNSGKRWIVVFTINDRHASSGQRAQDALIQWVQQNY